MLLMSSVRAGRRKKVTERKWFGPPSVWLREDRGGSFEMGVAMALVDAMGC